MPSKKRSLKFKLLNLKNIIKFILSLKKLINIKLLNSVIKKTVTGLLITLSITNVITFPLYLIFNFARKTNENLNVASNALLSVIITIYILQVLFWISFYSISLVKEKTTFDFKKSLFNKMFINYFVYNTLLIGTLFVILTALTLVFNLNFFVSLIIVSILYFGILSTIGFLPYFIITENNTLVESLVKSWKFSKLYFNNQLKDLACIYCLFVLPVSALIVVNQFYSPSDFRSLQAVNYVFGFISIVLIAVLAPRLHFNSFKTLRLRATYFRTKVSKIKLPKKFNLINKFGSVLTLALGVIMISFYVSQMINFVSLNVNASKDNIFGLNQLSPTKNFENGPYYIDGLNKDLNYDNFKIKFNDFYFLEPKNTKINSLCVLNFEILNSRDSTLLLPSFQLRISQNKEQLQVYTDELNLTENQLDPFKLYYLKKDIKFVGEIIYNCKDTKSQILVEFVPSRNLKSENGEDQFGNIGAAKAFETLSKDAEKNSKVKILLIINTETIRKINIENIIPVDLSGIVIEKKLEGNTLYCIVKFDLKNNYKRTINYQFYHLALIGKDGVLRAHTNFESIPAPQSYNVNIAPGYLTSIKHAFNCSDDASEYTIKYQPFENFGIFVNESIKEIQIII